MDDRSLIQIADQARLKAYAPYSAFQVGAAIITIDGKIFTGVNIENSSFGLTICAERVAIFEMIKNGEFQAEKVAIIGPLTEPLSPCGACRQVMAEFLSPKTTIIMAGQSGTFLKKSLGELLPFFFNFKDFKNAK